MSDDLFKKYKDAFLNESSSHLETMNASLLQLEKTPQDSASLHEIFRSAHTLKSMAATMGFPQLNQLCHAAEDVLDAVRSNHLRLVDCMDILFEAFDAISSSLNNIAQTETELDTHVLCERLQSILQNDGKDNNPSKHENHVTFHITEKLKTIGVKIDRLDSLMSLVEELLVSRIKLELIREVINNPELTAEVDNLGRHITDLQYVVMQVRLVPIGFLFNRFPRMVRDLSKMQHKDIDLKIEGGDIELDRSLIDEISESLGHLIRNAVDHGLETTEERRKAKKPIHSVITLSAKRTKEFAIIEVSDDGAGLDIEKIRKTAIEKNIISPEATHEEVVNSIFKGVSTSGKVTEISGRGLGLNIAKQKIESIGGSIQVFSKAGEGARFNIRLPLTLAVIKVLFVTVHSYIYAIPINHIERLLSVPATDIKGLLNFNAIVYEDSEIPLTSLAKLFSEEPEKMANYPVIVIKHGNDRFGIVVDSLLSTQEVVIKPLTKIVKENKYFSGTALIGTGEMVLILDVDQLFLSRGQQDEWRDNEISNAK